MTQPPVILASTSAYRAALLRRLLDTFTQEAPGTDEAPVGGEAPANRAARLAEAKARAVAAANPGSVVIGSDQVADLNGTVLDKPGTAHAAHTQLEASSGQEVIFHTAVCVIDTQGQAHVHVDETRVRFRTLSHGDITRYVERERPLDCAGSFKCEGLGISLFERIANVDPTALVGLPLIATSHLLRSAGIALP
ncbi:Maf family protein [Luteibacter aegosomatissinici]|uniref:Maf family protein n=1 Tax=Luteibacter aegosomatissinici TaxID=2911539 RepID=UPI001FFAE145|nr:nucleoside triphosphate pyrophosphatase [Luteibacter aegosomatissinici]UPG93102.1 Maf family nucleotide pyrophosphatase [Luteibacter aegosomatissinici]